MIHQVALKIHAFYQILWQSQTQAPISWVGCSFVTFDKKHFRDAYHSTKGQL